VGGGLRDTQFLFFLTLNITIMPNVAVIDISQKIIDHSFRPEVRISADNMCTIKFKILADSKPDQRNPQPNEEGERRDASFGANLVQSNPNKVRVKLIPEEKGGPRATLILEADLETKIPGTGSFPLVADETDQLNENYSAS
jgi:hypothetical protein